MIISRGRSLDQWRAQGQCVDAYNCCRFDAHTNGSHVGLECIKMQVYAVHIAERYFTYVIIMANVDVCILIMVMSAAKCLMITCL